MRKTKLIVLRGPSGSGKSTTAKVLFEKAKHRIALIEQDHYRFIFNPPGGGSKPNLDAIQKMIKSNVLIALNDGYDVILEGILNVSSFAETLDEIFLAHNGENHLYYFDISFEETIKRHRTKPNARDWSEDAMKEWYPSSHKSEHELEQIIPERFTLDQSVAYILKTSKLEVS